MTANHDVCKHGTPIGKSIWLLNGGDAEFCASAVTLMPQYLRTEMTATGPASERPPHRLSKG
jgi:hypothetical protein